MTMRKGLPFLILLCLVGWLMVSINRQRAQRLEDARRYYKRTGDIQKTIKLYPNTTADSLRGE